MSIRLSLTRRQLARLAVAGVAGALLASPVDAETAASPMPAKPSEPAAKTPREGDLLTQAVPVNAGYALTQAQAKEVATALKDYPGGFAKARAYVLPDDVEPAFAPYAPMAPPRKGRAQ